MLINFDSAKRLTASEILDKVPEQTIYEYYLRLSIKKDRFVKCCFHKDNSPSLAFYHTSNGKMMYKCFGCGAQGNVFSFVSRLHACDYIQSLKIIANDFRLGDANTPTYQRVEPVEIEYKYDHTQIIPTYRGLRKIDHEYWTERYYIPLSLTLTYNVKPCERVYIVKRTGEYILFAQHKNNNPIYSYAIDDRFKIYRPYNPDRMGKWVTNTGPENIQGMAQLPERGELLIITSSLKDVMVLNVLGYNAIALGGEGMRIPDSILDYLYACFDNIIIFYDNDEAGIQYAAKLSKDIGAGSIMIPTEYPTKDVSDFIDKYRLEETQSLMNKLI